MYCKSYRNVSVTPPHKNRHNCNICHNRDIWSQLIKVFILHITRNYLRSPHRGVAPEKISDAWIWRNTCCSGNYTPGRWQRTFHQNQNQTHWSSIYFYTVILRWGQRDLNNIAYFWFFLPSLLDDLGMIMLRAKWVC